LGKFEQSVVSKVTNNLRTDKASVKEVAEGCRQWTVGATSGLVMVTFGSL